MGIGELPSEGNLWPYFGFPDVTFCHATIPLEGLIRALRERQIAIGKTNSYDLDNLAEQDKTFAYALTYTNLGRGYHSSFTNSIDIGITQIAPSFLKNLNISGGMDDITWSFDSLLQKAAEITQTEPIPKTPSYQRRKMGYGQYNKTWALQRYTMINLLRYKQIYNNNYVSYLVNYLKKRTTVFHSCPVHEKDDNSAISDDAANAVNIFAYSNVIVVENADAEISVYNTMGGLVYKEQGNGVSNQITINGAGIYIVKVGNVAKRVVIN